MIFRDVSKFSEIFPSIVSTLLEDMESGANTSYDFGALFLWDVKLGQGLGETNLISLELGVMHCLEEDSLIVSLMFHGGLSYARVEDLSLRIYTLGWRCRFGSEC
jgi:hypothetical protein